MYAGLDAHVLSGPPKFTSWLCLLLPAIHRAWNKLYLTRTLGDPLPRHMWSDDTLLSIVIRCKYTEGGGRLAYAHPSIM